MSHTFSVDGTPHALDFFPTLLLLGDLRSLVSTHINAQAHTHTYTSLVLTIPPLQFMVVFVTVWLALVAALLSGKLSSSKKGTPPTHTCISPDFAQPQCSTAAPIQV